MNRFTTIGVLLLGCHLAVMAADSGFQPLTPQGYPINRSNPPPPAVVLPAAPPVAAVVNPPPATRPAEVESVALDDSHKLVPGDKLSFQILEDRHLPNLDNNRAPVALTELSKPLIVADTGELDVPYVGRVNVSGKTCKDMAAELKVLLEKDYYYRATVVLGLDQMSRVLGHVYVWGEVRNQGAIDIPPNEILTAGKAIVRAGMFTDWAKKTKVKIIRAANPDGSGKQEIIVDMEQVLEQGKIEKDVPLHPDDSIIVPRRTLRL